MQGIYYGKCKIIEEPLFAFITTIAIIHEDISIPLLQSLNMNLLQLLETERNSYLKLNFIRCLILKRNKILRKKGHAQIPLQQGGI